MRRYLLVTVYWFAGDWLATLWTRLVADGTLLAVPMSGVLTYLGVRGFVLVLDDKRLVPAAVAGAMLGTGVGLLWP